MKNRITLDDWQGDQRADQAPASIGLSLAVTPAEIVLDDASDALRVVKLELQDGSLRVLAYNGESDAPVIVTIPVDGPVEVNAADYEDERYALEEKDAQP